MTSSWSNWARNHSCIAERATVANEREIASIISSANRSQGNVRVVGTGHSFNGGACTTGVQIDMSNIKGVISIDLDQGQVEVKAGTSLSALNRELDGFGFAFPCLGSLANQTVGGALSVGYHGSSGTYGPLSSQIRSVSLIDGTGEKHILDSTETDIFKCVKTSFGSLGVITEVRMDVVPSFQVEVDWGVTNFHDWIDSATKWVEEADYPQWSFKPGNNLVAIKKINRVSRAPDRFPWIYDALKSAEHICSTFGLGGKRMVPGHIAMSHRAFTVREYTRHVSCEYSFPLSEAKETLLELNRALKNDMRFSKYPLTVRISPSDDSVLGMSSDRASIFVNGAFSSREQVLLREFDAACREVGGRPHWGKEHFASSEYLSDRYPSWRIFADVRERLDPNHVFSNDYICRVLD